MWYIYNITIYNTSYTTTCTSHTPNRCRIGLRNSSTSFHHSSNQSILIWIYALLQSKGFILFSSFRGNPSTSKKDINQKDYASLRFLTHAPIPVQMLTYNCIREKLRNAVEHFSNYAKSVYCGTQWSYKQLPLRCGTSIGSSALVASFTR